MNFDRPAFQRLITAVKQRMVYAIVVKDFSRFGRDYIEVGEYLERFLPFMGVRFLSAADSYDSFNTRVSDDKELEIAMKNIVNTYYSRDLSQKITSSVRNRRRKGEYVYAPRAFGYVEDPKDHSKIIIDPEAAKIVRRVFDLALEGKRTGQIAKALNKENLPIPSVYAERHNIKAKYNQTISDVVFWDTAKVRAILRNEIYTGTFIGQTTRRIIPGQKKVVYLDGREQAYIKNHHEAIVTYEEWKKAQEVIIKIAPNYHAPYKRHALKGKVICGNCGHTMLYTENKLDPSYYQCGYQMEAGWHSGQDIGCTKEAFDEGILNRLVFDGLKKWFETVKGADVKVKESEQRKWNKLKELGRQAEKIQSELFEQQNRKVKLYEDYTDGKVSREDFAEQKEKLSAEIDALKEKLDGLHRQESILKKSGGSGRAEFEQLVEQVDIFKDEIILTKTMADVFVEKVVIRGKFEIEVVWKWADAVESVLSRIDKEECELDSLNDLDKAV